MAHSVSGRTEIGRIRGLAHVLVKRIPSTIEAENQRAPRGAIGDPDAWMLIRRGTAEARIQFGVEGASFQGNRGWTEQRDGGHLGERGWGAIGGGL